MLSWDTQIALAYAAEELFLTAQALTTHFLSQDRALVEAHQHLHGLLQHERYLPAQIGARLRNLDASYSRREDSGAQDREGADVLAANTMSVLSDIRDVLAESDSFQRKAS